MHLAPLDAVFSALSDPTRRKMLERLARGPLTVAETAAGFPISQPAASKHIKVLEASGLVQRSVAGRVHHLRIKPEAMRGAATWIERQRKFWGSALDKLDDVLRDSTRKAKQ